MPEPKLAGRYSAEQARPWAHALAQALKAEEVKHLVYVPDSVFGPLLAVAEADSYFRLTAVHREEEAVGVACGLYLGGERAAMIVQSSGVGNCLNALGALALAGHLPVPVIVGLRGELGEFNPAQFPMGRAVPGCLSALGIQHFTIDDPSDIAEVAVGALMSCFAVHQPVGILLSARITGFKRRKQR